ncbi:MAG: hypothetical protein HYX47_10175 [Burkholderiales bacterium]|nr:hypothetical protein [Burkholderiales bacterium]
MPKLSQFIPGLANAQLQAGEAVAANDAILVGPDSLGYKVQNTVSAAFSSSGDLSIPSQGQMSAQVALSSVTAWANTSQPCRLPMCNGTDGSVFMGAPNAASNNGLRVFKYSMDGKFLGSVLVETAATAVTGATIQVMANGWLLVSWMQGNNLGRAAYIGQDLAIMLAAFTTGTGISGTGFHGFCPLAAGGFATVRQDAATAATLVLTTYSNAGAVVLATMPISVSQGGSSTVWTTLKQLSNGTLLVAVRNNGQSAVGLFNSTTGATVLAFFDPVGSASGTLAAPLEVSVMTNYFAISTGYTGTLCRASVFNLAGALQGAAYTSAANSDNPGPCSWKLLNDGTAFYLLYSMSAGAVQNLAKLPTTGTNYVTTSLTTTLNAALFDAFLERGFIVQVANKSAWTKPKWTVISTASLATIVAPADFGTAAGTAAGSNVGIIAGGDFSFATTYDYSNVTAVNMFMGKYANSAVAGVAADAAALGAVFDVSISKDIYPINAIAGIAGRSFDHSSASGIAGNKGTLLNRTLVLGGYTL